MRLPGKFLFRAGVLCAALGITLGVGKTASAAVTVVRNGIAQAAVSGAASDVRVFINGRPIPCVNARGEAVPEYSAYSEPASFDITSALIPNAANQITIRGKRVYVNELGSGGLLSPVYLNQEK